jgi:hypothetical protein
MAKRLQLAAAEVGVTRADDPSAEQAKLQQLRADLSTDGDVRDALDVWCTARDATPPDLAALADAAGKLKLAADRFQKLLPDALDNDVVAEQRTILGRMIEGILVEVAGEGQQALAGERISRGSSSDVPTYHLTRMTRDSNWSSRLESSGTWRDAGKMVQNAIGKRALDQPVSKAIGKLNMDPVLQRFSDLDAAMKARDRSAGNGDYETRSDVLRAYLGLATELKARLDAVRSRQDELASARNASPGWSETQTISTGDVLAGVARALRDALAADPLLQDPDLAGSARRTAEQIAALASRTSLEALVEEAGDDLRKVWRTAKASELKALKASNADLGDLPGMFDKGLGLARSVVRRDREVLSTNSRAKDPRLRSPSNCTVTGPPSPGSWEAIIGLVEGLISSRATPGRSLVRVAGPVQLTRATPDAWLRSYYRSPARGQQLCQRRGRSYSPRTALTLPALSTLLQTRTWSFMPIWSRSGVL